MKHARAAGAGRTAVALLAVQVAAGCGNGPAGPGPEPGDVAVRFVEVASGLTALTDLTAPAGDARRFLAEQRGRIMILGSSGVAATPFLDIRSRVLAGGERGLLGIAFHPQYGSNGHFYVSYTDLQGHSVVERYRVSANADVADEASAQLVLRVEQPFGNHNGGQIAFGPDGMLYIGLGDGGSGGDPLGHGQNPQTLLGALLRIDVDGGTPYRIPTTNPYATGGGRGEIWSIGLRNPWRFSFDPPSGRIFIADVGQNRREEINARPANAGGLNYGWNRMEGTLCFPAGAMCSTAGLVLPVHEYDNPAEGCSVTGGFVYRGGLIAALQGFYVYADFCGGWVRAFRLDGQGNAIDHIELGAGLGNIQSFGRDAAGELYVLLAAGRVLRIEPE